MGQTTGEWGYSVFEMDEEMLLSCDIYKHFKQDFDCDDAEEVAIAGDALEAYITALLGHLEQELKKQLPSRKLAWRDTSIKFVFSHSTTWDQATRKRFGEVVKRAGFDAPDGHSFEVMLDEAEATLLYFLKKAPKGDRPGPGERVLLAELGGSTSDDYFNATSATLCEEIWALCKAQMEDSNNNNNGRAVGHVVLAGGFLQSLFIRNELKQRFSKHAASKGARIVCVADNQVAVS